jgi:hypothetical protein
MYITQAPQIYFRPLEALSANKKEKPMSNYTDNATVVAAVLSNYFKGIFNGDVKLLRSVFHSQALVGGDVNGQPYTKTLDQYLEGVKNRKSPMN